MIVRIGGNAWLRALAVLILGWRILIPLGLYSASVFWIYKHFHLELLAIPATPVSILGAGLSIFLGFKNSASYDRWWEARKIWGGVVNSSRTFGMEVMTLLRAPGDDAKAAETLQQHQKDLIYRHLAWINALRLQLRKQDLWQDLTPLLSPNDGVTIAQARNKATMLNHMQGQHLSDLHHQGYLNDFQQMKMHQTLTDFYDLQGKCERIKNTPFPRYYRYFTRVFLLLFVCLLPFVMLKPFGIVGVPISTSLAFAFWLIERSGWYSENPFDNGFNDTPMTALCRTIEIDMRQQLGETDLPEPLQPLHGILM